MPYIVTWRKTKLGKQLEQFFRSKRDADRFASIIAGKGRLDVVVKSWSRPRKRSGRYGPYKVGDNAIEKRKELEAAGYMCKLRETASGTYVYYRKVNW